jgi:SSS family solute:Na+ symporter
MFEQVKEVNEALLSTPGPKGLFTPQFLIASFFAILLIPVTQPQVTTRLVIIKNNRTLFHMAVGLGIFTALVLLPTIVIGLYGAVKYGDLATSDFLAKVLLHEQPDILAAVVVVGLLAAATSTADSQLFALGSEFRSFILVKRKSPLFVTRLVILSFGMAALIFSIISSNQLVLLALASFKGTSLMAPMVFAGIFAKRKPGIEIPLATAVALMLFLASLAKWVPGKIGFLQLDLFLLMSLGILTLISVGIRSRVQQT